MKIAEVTQSLHTYRAVVRVHLPDRALTATTSIGADSLAQARALLLRIYGVGNVVSVSETVRETAPQRSQTRNHINPEPALFRIGTSACMPISQVVGYGEGQSREQTSH